jgi:hypothetical protein
VSLLFRFIFVVLGEGERIESWAIVIIKSVKDRLFNYPPLSARYDDIRSENMRGKRDNSRENKKNKT